MHTEVFKSVSNFQMVLQQPKMESHIQIKKYSHIFLRSLEESEVLQMKEAAE